MTSPSAAHTGIAAGVAEHIAAHGQFPAPHLLMATAELLVDAGHASWCPTCAGSGWTARTHLAPGRTDARYGPCTRCRGGRLNPFHGCTFTADPPCTCTTTCAVYRPTETPT